VTKTKTGCFDISVEDHRVGGRFVTPGKMSNHIFYSKMFIFFGEIALPYVVRCCNTPSS
jgi:hypothetical protein